MRGVLVAALRPCARCGRGRSASRWRVVSPPRRPGRGPVQLRPGAPVPGGGPQDRARRTGTDPRRGTTRRWVAPKALLSVRRSSRRRRTTKPRSSGGSRTAVQTNEVGRSAVLVGGYAAITHRTSLPLRVLEIGASAGLNLRWDHYAYDTGRVVCGPPDSPVRFSGIWDGDPPDLPGGFEVAERGGCDRNPLDATTPEGRLTLMSFVWPDQADRFARLEAAIEVARRVPVTVERADADAWVADRLARPLPGLATVVVHSIVLQYLPKDTRAPGCARRSTTPATGRRARLPWRGCAWNRRGSEPSCASPRGRGARSASSPPPATTATRSGGATPAADPRGGVTSRWRLRTGLGDRPRPRACRRVRGR